MGEKSDKQLGGNTNSDGLVRICPWVSRDDIKDNVTDLFAVGEDRLWIKDGFTLWAAVNVVLRGLGPGLRGHLPPSGHSVLVHVDVSSSVAAVI